jgi:hypothetical protein
MQAVLQIEELPAAPLDASAAFHTKYLDAAMATLEGDADHLVLSLPPAPSDHDDWRRALARDLARKFAPKRAIVLGGGDQTACEDMLVYLRGAPGVTGQYLPLHD